MEMLPDRFSLWPLDDVLQFLDTRLANLRQRSKMRQELLCRFQADSFDLTKFRGKRSASAPFAMEGDGKTMAFIADLLNEPQDRRAPFQHYGLVLTARDVNNLFSLCDARQLLVDNVQFVESRLRCV